MDERVRQAINVVVRSLASSALCSRPQHCAEHQVSVILCSPRICLHIRLCCHDTPVKHVRSLLALMSGGMTLFTLLVGGRDEYVAVTWEVCMFSVALGAAVGLGVATLLRTGTRQPCSSTRTGAPVQTYAPVRTRATSTARLQPTRNTHNIHHSSTTRMHPNTHTQCAHVGYPLNQTVSFWASMVIMVIIHPPHECPCAAHIKSPSTHLW